jgi:hypothetical protein
VPLLNGRFGWTGLTWCATVGLSYLVWNQRRWELPTWVMLVEYAPVFVVLVIELIVAARTARTSPQPPAEAPALASTSC